MEKEFIPYTEALALKELGFDEPCLGLWNLNNGKYEVDIIGVCQYSKEFKYREVLAPLYQQAFRWFREKHNLLGNVYSNASGWLWEIHDNIGGTHRFGSEWSGDCEESGMFTSFEKAELECLKKLIEIIKTP
jgi:hypothetical protein